MRFPVLPFVVDERGHRREVDRPFYLTTEELDALKGDSFRSIWKRDEVRTLLSEESIEGLEVTDPWGHTLFDLTKPSDPH